MNVVPPQNNGNNGVEEVDISKIIQFIKKNLTKLFIFLVIFTVLGIIRAFTQTPIYQANGVILIGTNTTAGISDKKQRFEELDVTKTNYYKTQYAILQSRSLIKNVIDDLNLLENQEFAPRKRKSLIDLSGVKKGINSSIQFVLISLGLVEPSKNTQDVKPPDPVNALVDVFKNRLIISPVSQSHVVNVGFQGYDPIAISIILNKLINEMIQTNIDRRGKILSGSEKWMSEKVLQLKEKMKFAEQKIASFRKRNNIINYRKNRELSALNLSKHQEKIREVNAEQLRLQSLKELLLQLKFDPIGLLNSLPDDVKTLTINQLITDYSTILKKYEDTVSQYSPIHPRVQQLQYKLASQEQKIPMEIDRLIRSIDIDSQGVSVHAKSLKRSMEIEKKKIMKLDNEEFTFNSLTDEFESNKILHNDLLKRFKEVDIASYSNESAIQVVDFAEVPYQPIKPKKIFTVALFGFLGLIVGCLSSLYSEKTKQSVITVEDVLRQIQVPFLGATGIIDKKDLPLPVVHDSNTFLAEEFRTVKTNLMMNGFVDKNKVLMVSSSSPSEGKTTVLTNLAATFAQDRKRVLIIEADFTRPKVANILKTENKFGLLDVLGSPKLFQRIMASHIADSSKIDEVFSKSPIEGVYVLSKGGPNGSQPDILNYGIFEKILTVTRKVFDVVLIDTPPTLAFSYVSVIAQLSDGVLFVIGSGMKDKEMIRRTLDKLTAATSDASFGGRANGDNGQKGSDSLVHQSKVFGVVLNKVKYQRDEYYEYHRKYFQEYYSTSKVPS